MSEHNKKYPFLDLKTANQQYMTALRRAATDVIDSGRYIGGVEVEMLNTQMAELCQAPLAIGVSNGLDALRLIFEAYKAMGRLKEGDEVIVPTNTFIATVLALTHSGLKPILVDPDEVTMNLSADGISKAMTANVKAVVLVHLFGRVCWDDDIAQIIRENNLIAIEDAAQAIGARSAVDGLFGSRQAGALCHAGAFSFYPTKNIGALGDAGAVITHDSELAATVSALANYGSDRRYHNIYTGFNCRLDPIQAAMLRVKIADTDNANARRFARAVAYNRHIQHPEIILPKIPALPMECVWHQYVIRVAAEKRDAFRVFLHENGVETDIHYPVPVHLQPCYASLPHGALPVSEKLASESVSLPIGDHISEMDAREIAEIINKFK